MSKNTQKQNELVTLLLKAPDDHLDASMFPYINEWDTPPKAVQVLEVLDYCVHAGLASGLVMTVLETLLRDAIEAEQTTYEEVVKKATWRDIHAAKTGAQ